MRFGPGSIAYLRGLGNSLRVYYVFVRFCSMSSQHVYVSICLILGFGEEALGKAVRGCPTRIQSWPYGFADSAVR